MSKTKPLPTITALIIGLTILNDVVYDHLIRKNLRLRAFLFFPIRYIRNKGKTT